MTLPCLPPSHTLGFLLNWCGCKMKCVRNGTKSAFLSLHTSPSTHTSDEERGLGMESYRNVKDKRQNTISCQPGGTHCWYMLLVMRWSCWHRVGTPTEQRWWKRYPHVRQTNPWNRSLRQLSQKAREKNVLLIWKKEWSCGGSLVNDDTITFLIWKFIKSPKFSNIETDWLKVQKLNKNYKLQQDVLVWAKKNVCVKILFIENCKIRYLLASLLDSFLCLYVFPFDTELDLCFLPISRMPHMFGKWGCKRKTGKRNFAVDKCLRVRYK